jgi:hypothetical protein
MESGGSTYEIQIDPVQEFPSLSHVINIASNEIVPDGRLRG